MKIPDEYIEKLRSHGLFVAKPMSSRHAFPDGVLVGKPIEVVGNYIPDYSTAYVIDLAADQKVRFDAPPLWFFAHSDVWVVHAQDSSPICGPGDFIDEWINPDEAVKDILDFYFGDPKRMQEKAKAQKTAVGDSQRNEHLK